MTEQKNPFKGKLLFDGFTIYARVFPAAVCALPFLLTSVLNAVAKGFNRENILLLAVFLGALALGTNIVRRLGKKQEAKLYDQLLGMPTTIIQRFSDDRINAVSKQRYHATLNKKYGLNLPLSSDDERPEDDEGYKAAADSLRIYANNHRDKYPRVYQELKEYNFIRNLYGLKCYAIIVYFLSALLEVYKLFRAQVPLKSVYDFLDIIINPSKNAVIVYILAIVVFLFVRFSVVEERSFDYAKALIEVSEGLDEDSAISDKES